MDAAALIERAWPSVPADWRDGRLRVLAAGKAAVGMTRALLARVGEPGDVLVIAPRFAGDEDFDVLEGGHPLPTAASVHAGRRALDFVSSARDRLIVLLSGGASALMAVPAVGLTLEDKAAATGGLLSGGAGIHQVNTVRKHLSALKGGQLAVAGRARVLTLAISDVVGDDLSVIGSGPTVPDASTFAEALDVLQGVGTDWPEPVSRRLRLGASGAIAETPKPGDRRLEGHVARVIGGRFDAMAGAARAAEERGYRTVVIEAPVEGEARHAGARLLDHAAVLAGGIPDAMCLVASGETTVRVTGEGRGGRNQEVVLGCVEGLAGFPRSVAVASLGTDGIDGPTIAAGAVADSRSASRGRALGLSPADVLRRNDAFTYFEALGDQIVTGPTGTNVGDLQVILIAPLAAGPGGPAGV